MNNNVKRFGAGIAAVIAGTALTLPPVGAAVGRGIAVERSCLGTAFDVVCFEPMSPASVKGSSVRPCVGPTFQGVTGGVAAIGGSLLPGERRPSCL